MPDVPAEGSAGPVPTEADVVVVGGGPAGCSAGIFTARYGLDTVVFDRGPSSLRRCAYLENYPGFPGGVDVSIFYELLHDHARAAGCSVVPDVVESIDRDEAGGFVVETADGRTMTVPRVLAATRYGGGYLRGLDDPDAMFRAYDSAANRDYLDPDWVDDDGRTPVDGCYVATAAGERDVQAVVAAGQGAHVARTLLADHRRDLGYPDGVANHYDWMRLPTAFEGEAGDRDYWRERFDARAGEHDTDPALLADLRERDIDRRFATAVPDAEVATRWASAQRRLVDHLDPEVVLDAIDDDRIREYLDE